MQAVDGLTTTRHTVVMMEKCSTIEDIVAETGHLLNPVSRRRAQLHAVDGRVSGTTVSPSAQREDDGSNDENDHVEVTATKSVVSYLQNWKPDHSIAVDVAQVAVSMSQRSTTPKYSRVTHKERRPGRRPHVTMSADPARHSPLHSTSNQPAVVRHSSSRTASMAAIRRSKSAREADKTSRMSSHSRRSSDATSEHAVDVDREEQQLDLYSRGRRTMTESVDATCESVSTDDAEKSNDELLPASSSPSSSLAPPVRLVDLLRRTRLHYETNIPSIIVQDAAGDTDSTSVDEQLLTASSPAAHNDHHRSKASRSGSGRASFNFFADIRDLNEKIVSGKLTRRLSPRSADHGAAAQHNPTDKRPASTENMTFSDDNPPSASRRSVQEPMLPSNIKLFYSPPLLSLHCQNTEPKFFAGIELPYKLPERLPDQLSLGNYTDRSQHRRSVTAYT